MVSVLVTVVLFGLLANLLAYLGWEARRWRRDAQRRRTGAGSPWSARR